MNREMGVENTLKPRWEKKSIDRK